MSGASERSSDIFRVFVAAAVGLGGSDIAVGQGSVADRPLEQLCGLVVPPDWQARARYDHQPARLGLPPAFDWRAQGGCPPVRDQGSCGSCWAFATAGPLECNILIHDGVEVDLSEQWLISCNRESPKWGCTGGWWAHDYHQWQTDACGHTGAVREADFPYAAGSPPCDCPYFHPYAIDTWAYIGDGAPIPTVDQIKQAILDHGPVSAAVRAEGEFITYGGGVFSTHYPGEVNHGVVLVGWDDGLGAAGAWILRNSWGTGWGESGYMYIEYGCSSIGYAACYVQYTGPSAAQIWVTPPSIAFGDVAVGASVTQSFTVQNVGGQALSGSAGGLGLPFSFDGLASYTLDPGQSQAVTVRFAPTLPGAFDDTVSFSGGSGATATVSGVGVGDGPADSCTRAPEISDGTFTGSNVGADTSLSPPCGGTADVWWRYVPPQTRVLTLDTCGSDFDTILGVYSGCSGSELACNDNYDGCAGGLASRVSLEVSAAVTYYIRVAGGSPANGNIVLNVTSTPATRTISGRVRTIDGAGVPEVTISGLPGNPLTDNNGDYVAEVEYGFSGTAVPQKAGCTFTPPNRSYTSVTVHQTNQDYTVVPPNFVISGRVADEVGAGISGVLITGLPGTPVTGADGRYAVSVPMGFSGTAMPSKSAYVFEPATRAYVNVTADVLGQDYVGHVQTGSLQITLGPAEARAAGALWRVDAGDWHVSDEVVAGLTVGQHTVSFAVRPGWIEPTSESVLIARDQTTHLERAYTQRMFVLTVLVDPVGAGSVALSPPPNQYGQYVYDTRVALTALPHAGFRVRSWTGADAWPATGSSMNTATMTTSRTVVVRFELEPFQLYQLEAHVAGGAGSIWPTRLTARAGTVVALTGTPAENYRVAGWSGTDHDASTATTNTVTLNAHKSVGVTFAPLFDCNADGLPDSENIAAGKSADCDANGVPDECQADSDGDGLIDACDPTNDRAPPVPPAPPPPGPLFGLCGFGVAVTLVAALVSLALLRRSAALGCARVLTRKSVADQNPERERRVSVPEETPR